MVEFFEDRMRRGGDDAVREACLFLSGAGPVHATLRKVAGRLEILNVPYAVTGGMALVAHGYNQATVDVDIVLSPEGLEAARNGLEDLGRLLLVSGRCQFRDAETGVRVDFLMEGRFAAISCSPVELEGIRYVSLERLVETKLAFGMARPGRLKHLADVQELIRELHLADDFGGRLSSCVRDMYATLWKEVHENPA